MCALLESPESDHYVEPGSKAKSTLVTVVSLLVVGSVVGGIFYYKTRSTEQPVVAAGGFLESPGDVDPVALLVEDVGEAGVLPHTVDSATEFKDSFSYLEEGVDQPKYRKTQDAPENEAVRVDTPKSLSEASMEQAKPTVEADFEKVVELEEASDSADGMTKPSSVSYQSPSGQTNFGKDWDGTVLVPVEARMSKAYSSDVSLSRVEAHPLNNSRLRVWARVNNETRRKLSAMVSCNFRSVDEQSGKTSFVPVQIPVNQAVDIYFMSPFENVKAYTILVK